MHRTFWMALAAIGVSGLLATAACDSEDDGDGGGGSTATGTPGSGGAGAGSCSCYPCADYLVACTSNCPPGHPTDVVCPGSLPTLNTVNECLCDAARGNCAADCAWTCAQNLGGSGPGGSGAGGGPVDGPDCVPCQGEAITDVCKTEFDACAAMRDCS